LITEELAPGLVLVLVLVLLLLLAVEGDFFLQAVFDFKSETNGNFVEELDSTLSLSLLIFTYQ
jgi:hypothetical protein